MSPNIFALLVIILPVALAAVPNCVDCPQYVGATASEKSQAIWQRLSSTEYSNGFPSNWINIITANVDIGATWANSTINESFDRFSDEYMTAHTKVIHTYGTTAMVNITPVANNLGLSGLFNGPQIGVIRPSLVKDPVAPCLGVPFTKGCFSPGIAMKVFRSGTYSSNLIAMYTLGDGQAQNFNFMQYQQKTWVPPVTGLAAKIVMYVFSKASDPPNVLSNIEYAQTGANFDPLAKYPMNVYFVPNPKLQFSTAQHEFRADFQKVPVGTLLYTMVVGVDVNTGLPAQCLCSGIPCPDIYNAPGCKAVVIANVTTSTRFVASQYGDQMLFFQHTRPNYKKRVMCRRKGNVTLPSNDEFRMAGDNSLECLAADSRNGPCPVAAVVRSGCPFDPTSGMFSGMKKPSNHP